MALNINELLQLMQGHVYSPQETMSLYEGQQEAQQAKRAERRAAQAQSEQAALMQGLIGQAATAGLPVEDVLLNAGRASKLSGAPPSMDLLASLLAGSTQQSGNQWETSPLLDVADRRAIMQQAQEARAKGTPINQIRADIHNHFRTVDFNTYKDVADSIDELIRKAVGG